jgi:hypothetical protein
MDVKTADDTSKTRKVGTGPKSAMDFVTVVEKQPGDVASDPAGRAGEEDFQKIRAFFCRWSPVVWLWTTKQTAIIDQRV